MLTDGEEDAWIAGNRAAWARLLGQCLRELGYDSPETTAVRWAVEREAAVVALRQVCAEHGDNEWEPTLHLADVIEKHLHNHLSAEGDGDE